MSISGWIVVGRLRRDRRWRNPAWRWRKDRGNRPARRRPPVAGTVPALSSTHFVRPGVGPIDLVDDHDRPQPALEGLRQHEPRLRHGPLGRIDQHQRPVGHAQHAFHLAAEIGVAGRVDDVDLHALVGDGDILGQDRDAALAFQIVGVEDLLADQLASRGTARSGATCNRPGWSCRGRRGR